MVDKAMIEKGMKIRRQVLGDAHVEKRMKEADEFGRDWQEFQTAYCWGETWGRPGLTLKQRSTLVLTLLAAFGRAEEMKGHLRGAMRNGVTKEEIKEIFIQVAVYCGAPTAGLSFKVAREVFEEDGIL